MVNVKDVKSVTDLTFFALLLTRFRLTLIAAISRETFASPNPYAAV